MRTDLYLSQAPFSPKQSLVVGVSGGADSLALLFLLLDQLSNPGRRFIVAHVNYGLRGKESEKDERSVRVICRRLGLSFERLKVVDFVKKVKQTGLSPQDLARKIRYHFFKKVVKRHRAWGVAVAHHQEDQAETVLDRLLRGAGSRGLSGLKPVQKLNLTEFQGFLYVWRPLLRFTKGELREYLKSSGISWREDQSNRTDRYRRNQIRHRIIPFLKQWNPNLVETLARVGEVAASEDHFFDGFLESLGSKLKSHWEKKGYCCGIKEFKKAPQALQRRWVRHVAETLAPQARGLSFERIEEIIRLWECLEKGPRDLGFGLVAGQTTAGKAFLRLKCDPRTQGRPRKG